MTEIGKICLWTVRPGTIAPLCGLRGAGERQAEPTLVDVPGSRVQMRQVGIRITLCQGHLVRWDNGERDTDPQS